MIPNLMTNFAEDAFPDTYDFVVLGTGLAETIVSSLLASAGKYSILAIDTSPVYGGDCSTLQYSHLLRHFNATPTQADRELLLKSREFNIDLTPKLLLQDSPLKELFLKCDIQEIVSFTSIKGSFLFTSKLHSIPTNEAQSLKSSAISLFQKPRVVRFFWNVRSFFKTTGIRTKPTMREEFEHFGLNSDSVDFIGHAVALNLNDEYLEQHPAVTYERIIRYVSSIVCYEGTESPYIYPLYGLSEICQAFARRAALHGATFMLNAKITSINNGEISLVDPDGMARTVKAGRIIADPRFFESSRTAKQIIRCIMILENTKGGSRNITFLKRQLKRQNDVFCVILGAEEMACPEKYEIGILSTVKETDNPEAEIAGVLCQFKVIRKFVEVRSLFENDDTSKVCFTRGIDESALMDNVYDDISRILKALGLEKLLGTSEGEGKPEEMGSETDGQQSTEKVY